MTTSYKPQGFTTLTPFLVVAPAAQAIDFYVDVFGARVVSRMDLPDGQVAHAELELEDGRFQLGDPNDAYGIVAHDGATPATHSIAIYVADCDATTEAAAKGGATVREQPATFVTGDRFASIVDPYGVRWTIMTRVEEVSDAEAERRVNEWLAAQG